MIERGKVVVIHYTLTVDGTRKDTSRGRQPLAYLHGHRNIVSGLEAALEGKEPGDTLTVDVPPEEGYGERTGPGPQRMPKKELPDGLEARKGARFRVPGPDRDPIILHITDEKGRWVWVDINHPLAGETLHFDVEVVDVREALPEELEHGHAHGVHGHGGH